jgi:putative FmdB family regulatory protein
MVPIREFICLDCGHEFETLVRADDPPADCPHCEKNHTEQLISAFGGYSMASGGSSTRPRQAGAFRGKKEKK